MSPSRPSLPPEDPARELRSLLGEGRFQECLMAYRLAGGSAEARRPEVQLAAATAATRLGDFATAIALAEASMDGFWTRMDDDGRMRALNLLGVIAFEHGQIGEAEQRLQDAWQLARKLDDSLMAARAANNLASASHLRGEAVAALGLYRACLLSYQRLGDRRGLAETYHNLALVYRMLRRLADAESATEQAVRHAELVGEDGLLALALSGRAELRLIQEESDLAERDLAAARTKAVRAGDTMGEADIGRLTGCAALAQGMAAAALRHAEAAAALARRQGATLLEAECEAVAALALRRLERPADAVARADRVRVGFRRLGASALLREFEDDWVRAAPG